MRRQHGLTLVELLVTLVIAGIVLGLAVPSFQQMIANNQIVSQINTVSGSIAFARSSAAIQPQNDVTLCSSNDSSSCSGSSEWEHGWIVFRDIDGDGAVDGGDDEILRVHSSLGSGNTLRILGFDGTASQIQFSGDGAPRGAGTLTVCNARGVQDSQSVVVSGAGQVRQVRDGNDHTGSAIVCP